MSDRVDIGDLVHARRKSGRAWWCVVDRNTSTHRLYLRLNSASDYAPWRPFWIDAHQVEGVRKL